MANSKTGKALTQAQLVASIAESVGITKKQVKESLEALKALTVKNNKIATPLGNFKKITKPARPARKGVNPFTGEPTTFKAKPKQIVLKFQPNKATKEALN